MTDRMSDPRASVSHQMCIDAGEHVCQKPSGETCIEMGCDRLAGTLWGPLWCPEHDQERLDRISRQMAEISASFGQEHTEQRRLSRRATNDLA